MFSRFFSNIHFRRVLCCLLALLTFGCCLSPAFVQPAEAVAVADDVLIASLALLATSWAGVTFATNGGDNTAISNLLQSKPAVKLSLAGLMGTVAKITAAWVHAILLYYSYSAILRWLKMVE